jgi:hypothetical protein
MQSFSVFFPPLFIALYSRDITKDNEHQQQWFSYRAVNASYRMLDSEAGGHNAACS